MRALMPRLPLSMLFLMSLIVLSGCQTTSMTPAESAAVANSQGGEPVVCRVWHDWWVNAFDARDTRRQAAGNNAARRAYGCRPEIPFPVTEKR